MLTKSAKSKGRWLQNWTRDQLLANASSFLFHPTDIKVAVMGEKGADIKLSFAAQKIYPYQIECKNLKKFVGYKYYKQAQSFGELIPLVVVKANNEEPLVILKAVDFFKLAL